MPLSACTAPGAALTALGLQIVDQALQERVQALQQVMGELNSIASRPMNRYASDLPAQQQVKSGAYSLLRHLAGGDNEKEPTSPR